MHEEKGWIGEGGVDHQTRVTTWEHYEEVRKINKFISNLNQEGTWEIKLSDFNIVFWSFFCSNTNAGINSLGWHHVKSESIHDERRWWERKYEIIRWIGQGQIYQLAGMVEYVRVARTSDAVEKSENVENHFPNSQGPLSRWPWTLNFGKIHNFMPVSNS